MPSATSSWELHPRLLADTIALTSEALCEWRLMNDQRWPWLILVPRVEGAGEWIDLSASQRGQLDSDITAAATVLRELFPVDRINVAALGNVVPQLHVHVVARTRGDAAWPAPVWGFGAATPYPETDLVACVGRIQERLRQCHRESRD